MVVVPTEVVWKWKHYGNNSIAVFPLCPLLSKMFFNLSANNSVVRSWNQSDILRCQLDKLLHLPSIMSDHQEVASLSKRVIKWGSFNKQTFSGKTTCVKAINKINHLKVVDWHFFSKIKKKTL